METNTSNSAATPAVVKPMTVSYERQYRKSNSKITFVYKVLGTEEQIKEYLASKGEFAAKCNPAPGVVLLFSPRYVGQKADLIKTFKGEFRPDTTEADKFANLVEQYGIDVAKDMMKQPIID